VTLDTDTVVLRSTFEVGHATTNTSVSRSDFTLVSTNEINASFWIAVGD